MGDPVVGAVGRAREGQRHADPALRAWRSTQASISTGFDRFLLVDSPLSPMRTGRQPEESIRDSHQLPTSEPAMSAAPAIEFGMMLRGTRGIEASAWRIEELGFDYVGSGEHVAFHVPTPNNFISLAAAAGATQRVKLLSAVTVLPLYPAVLAAKLAAALDVASGGRLTLGVGVGGEYPRGFEACGVPVHERGARGTRPSPS